MLLDFKFNDRLFQRGQLWRECVEEWLAHRNAFLQSVQEPPLLLKSLKILNQQKARRFVLIYSINSLDSVVSLPFIGATLHTSRQCVTRFFCYEYFFPLFSDVLDRGFPKLLSLDKHGSVKELWGPRPQSVTDHVSEQMGEGKSKDRALTEFARQHYPTELDLSLSRALREHL